MLPTYLSVSSITPGQVGFSLAGFAVFYTVLAVVELFLMLKYIRLGPDGLAGTPESGRVTPGPSRYAGARRVR